VEVPFEGHERVLVAGTDAMAVTPPFRVADRLFPTMPWTAREEFEADPWRPLVRTERARGLLEWSPVHTWAANADTSTRRRRGSSPLTVWRNKRAARRARY
jgi:hypothetical protein